MVVVVDGLDWWSRVATGQSVGETTGSTLRTSPSRPRPRTASQQVANPLGEHDFFALKGPVDLLGRSDLPAALWARQHGDSEWACSWPSVTGYENGPGSESDPRVCLCLTLTERETLRCSEDYRKEQVQRTEVG